MGPYLCLLAIFAVGSLAGSPSCHATTRHVPAGYATIQAAMNAAVAGDSVLVAPGTYTNCDGGPCLPNIVAMKSGVALLSEGGPDVTVLRVDTPGGSINMIQGVGVAGVLLHGFTVTGTAPGYGGAAFLTCQNVEVSDCRFVDITSGQTLGAGLLGNGASMTVRNCEFRRCVSLQGGALWLQDATVVVEGCIVEDCAPGGAHILGVSSSSMSATIRGSVFRDNANSAALQVLTMPTAEISGNLFLGNSSSLGASALVVTDEGAQATLRGNLFVANIATGSGTPTVAWVASGEIRENTFWGNTALRGSAIRHLADSGTTVSSNNIFVANLGGPAYWVNFTQPQGSCNDFWSNPGGDYFHYVPSPTDLFVDPLLCDPVTLNFHLMTGSPCLPEDSGVCGLIGAFGQGCGPVSVEPVSWGHIKSVYRDAGDAP